MPDKDIKSKSILLSYLGVFLGGIGVIFFQPYCLEPSTLGLFRFYSSFASLWAMIVPLGVGNFTLRFFSSQLRNGINPKTFVYLNLTVPLIGIAVWCLIFYFIQSFLGFFFQSQELVEFLWISPILILLYSYFALFSITLQCLDKPIFPAFFSDFFNRFLLIILFCVTWFFSLSNSQFLTGLVFVLFIPCALLFYKILSIIQSHHKTGVISVSFLTRNMLIYSITMALVSLFSLAIKSIDLIILGRFMPLASIGVYGLAVFLPSIIEIPVFSMERIYNARIADLWGRGKIDELKDINEKSSSFLIIFSSTLALFIACFSDLVFHFFLPDRFWEGYSVTIILIFSTLLNAITGLNGSILSTSGQYIRQLYFLLISIVFQLIFLFILIPKFGLSGAAISTALGSVMYNFLKSFYIYKSFNILPFHKNMLKRVILIFFVLVAFAVTEFFCAEYSIQKSTVKFFVLLTMFYFFCKWGFLKLSRNFPFVKISSFDI